MLIVKLPIGGTEACKYQEVSRKSTLICCGLNSLILVHATKGLKLSDPRDTEYPAERGAWELQSSSQRAGMEYKSSSHILKDPLLSEMARGQRLQPSQTWQDLWA